MANIEPLDFENPAQADPELNRLVVELGYRPNAILTMARKPGLVVLAQDLLKLIYLNDGTLQRELKHLVGVETTRISGSFYTTVHLVHAAHTLGAISWQKISAIENYNENPLFNERERAALAVADVGGRLPMGNSRGAFIAASKWYSEAELVDIAAVIAMFGFFSRWNSLVQTDLEDVPAGVIENVRWLARWRECGAQLRQ